MIIILILIINYSIIVQIYIIIIIFNILLYEVLNEKLKNIIKSKKNKNLKITKIFLIFVLKKTEYVFIYKNNLKLFILYQSIISIILNILRF